MKRLRSVPGCRAVQCRQDGRIGGRQVAVEVEAMHVDEVDRPAGERCADRLGVPPPCRHDRRLVVRRVEPRHGHQTAGNLRVLARNDHGPNTACCKAALEMEHNLLHTAHRVGADGRADDLAARVAAGEIDPYAAADELIG